MKELDGAKIARVVALWNSFDKCKILYFFLVFFMFSNNLSPVRVYNVLTSFSSETYFCHWNANIFFVKKKIFLLLSCIVFASEVVVNFHRYAVTSHKRVVGVVKKKINSGSSNSRTFWEKINTRERVRQEEEEEQVKIFRPILSLPRWISSLSLGASSYLFVYPQNGRRNKESHDSCVVVIALKSIETTIAILRKIEEKEEKEEETMSRILKCTASEKDERKIGKRFWSISRALQRVD